MNYEWSKSLLPTPRVTFFGLITAALDAATSGGDVGALPTISTLALFLRDSWWRLYQFRSVPFGPLSTASSDYFRGTGKSAGIQEASFSPFQKKKKNITKKQKKSSWTFTLYSHCQFFLHPVANLSFLYLERWYKNMVMLQEEGEGFSSLSVRFGNFFRRLASRSDPPVVNCAPIPKMVPHSLNEQKCIGELVRGRARALKECRRGGLRRTPPSAVSPPALRSLEGSAALQLRSPQKRKQKKKNTK